VGLSIDDFGTGYSSLGYLKRFSVDELKIDQSFVRSMLNNADDAAIALAIISLARSLRMRVVAEGVETVEQCRFLAGHGCDEIQGYYFSRPVPQGELAQMLAGGRRLQF
jgi:EAL domain-containing protein (putative c-di-GMP-specific phosphodiesterase class I)